MPRTPQQTPLILTITVRELKARLAKRQEFLIRFIPELKQNCTEQTSPIETQARMSLLATEFDNLNGSFTTLNLTLQNLADTIELNLPLLPERGYKNANLRTLEEIIIATKAYVSNLDAWLKKANKQVSRIIQERLALAAVTVTPPPSVPETKPEITIEAMPVITHKTPLLQETEKSESTVQHHPVKQALINFFTSPKWKAAGQFVKNQFAKLGNLLGKFCKCFRRGGVLDDEAESISGSYVSLAGYDTYPATSSHSSSLRTIGGTASHGQIQGLQSSASAHAIVVTAPSGQHVVTRAVSAPVLIPVSIQRRR